MNKKYKVILIILSIFLLISIIIGSSYAYYIFNISQRGTNRIKTECFEIVYSDKNPISLEETIPLSEEEGLKLTPYEFSVKNTCNIAASYYVNIETLSNSTLGVDYVRYQLDNENSYILGSLDNNETIVNDNASSSRTIKGAVLMPGEEFTHHLRLWVDENSTVEQSANKYFESKVVITATINYNPMKNVLLDSDGGDISYDKLEIINGREIGNIPTPEKEGFIFDGWFDDNGNEVNSSTIINENITIHARYTRITASMLDYSSEYTTCDNVQCALDELSHLE